MTNLKKVTVFLVALTVALFSCSKENVIPNTDSDGQYSITIKDSENNSFKNGGVGKSVKYEIKDNRIILQNSDDFQTFMWALETHNLDEWQKSTKFTSYRTSTNLDEKINKHDYFTENEDFIFDDRELASAINKEGVIQINPYLFKFNIDKQELLAYEISDGKDVHEDVFNSLTEVKTFSFDDDVWYLLENNLTPEEDNDALFGDEEESGKRCREEKARNKYKTQNSIYFKQSEFGAEERSYIKIRYNKFGIWEKVVSHFWNKMRYSPHDLRNVYATQWRVEYSLKLRCAGWYNGTVNYPGTYKNTKKTIWSNKKPVKRDTGFAKASVKVLNNGAPPPLSNTITIPDAVINF